MSTIKNASKSVECEDSKRFEIAIFIFELLSVNCVVAFALKLNVLNMKCHCSVEFTFCTVAVFFIAAVNYGRRCDMKNNVDKKSGHIFVWLIEKNSPTELTIDRIYVSKDCVNNMESWGLEWHANQ